MILNRPTVTRVLPLALMAVLAACKPAVSPPAASSPVDPPPVARPSSEQSPTQADTATTTATASEGTNMDKVCGGTTFRIVPIDKRPNATALQRVGSDGTASAIDPPSEMADYTPVGLGCAVATSDNKPYFVVQYGELPYGCEFCEWFYLYDADGKQLTRSDPPLLTDSSLPEREQQTSNTREYEQLIQKLGIKHPEVTYFK